MEKYDWDVDLAIEVIRYESGGYTQAKNMKDYHKSADCYGSYGLFQIGCLHGGNPLEPKENIEMAYAIYQGAKWSAWGVCDFESECAKLSSY